MSNAPRPRPPVDNPPPRMSWRPLLHAAALTGLMLALFAACPG